MKHADQHNPSLSRRFLRQVGSVFAECAYAQRRMTELWLAPDRYVIGPSGSPDTYAEFLYRTSGPLRHEPAARNRVKTS